MIVCGWGIGERAVLVQRERLSVVGTVDQGDGERVAVHIAVIAQHAADRRCQLFAAELHELGTELVLGRHVLCRDPVRATISVRDLHFVDETVEVVKRIRVPDGEPLSVTGNRPVGVVAGCDLGAIQIETRVMERGSLSTSLSLPSTPPTAGADSSPPNFTNSTPNWFLVAWYWAAIQSALRSVFEI